MLKFKIALKFIFKKPLQSFIILLVIIFGMSIFYFILISSQGLKNLVLSTTSDNTSHIYLIGDINFNGYNDPNIIKIRNELKNKDQRITDISYSYTTSGFKTTVP